jgi:hypothetical protein
VDVPRLFKVEQGRGSSEEIKIQRGNYPPLGPSVVGTSGFSSCLFVFDARSGLRPPVLFLVLAAVALEMRPRNTSRNQGGGAVM